MIINMYFQTYSDLVNTTGLHWRWVNIGSGNGFVQSGDKPLPKPMLTQIYEAIWHH